MRSLFLVAALVLAGCAATADAVRVGPNRYQIGADAMQARGGTAGAQRMATEGAATTCAARGMQANVLTVETGKALFSTGTATVTFECVPKQQESVAKQQESVPKQPESATAPPSDDKYKQLAELKQLLDSGALTQDEFNSEKAKILAKP